MTIDECIEALQGIKDKYPSGGDIEVVVGVGFGDGGKIETLSLQAEPSEDENQIVFEEEFAGDQPETQLAEKIKQIIRRGSPTDPWTDEVNPDFDDCRTDEDAVDEIVNALS